MHKLYYGRFMSVTADIGSHLLNADFGRHLLNADIGRQ